MEMENAHSDAASITPISWEQYGILIEDLWKNLQAKLAERAEVKIDAIIAILREGAFTAMPLAYKLNTYKVLTIQYKYDLFDGGSKLNKIVDLSSANFEIPDNPTFLLCDVFPCGGQTKVLAIENIRKRYPNAKFTFASLVQDLAADKSDDFIFTAHAFDIDEKWRTTHPLFKEMGIADNALDVYLPWENKEEEVAAVSGKAWKYN